MPFRYLYQRQSRKILTNQEDIQSRQNYCSTLANKWNFKSEIRRQGVWSFVPQFYTLLISVYWGHLNFDCPALKIDFGFIITYCFQMLFSSLFLELFEKNTYESRIRNHSIHTWTQKWEIERECEGPWKPCENVPKNIGVLLVWKLV